MNKIVCFLLLLLSAITVPAQQIQPKRFGALPSDKQLEWHALEMYAFIHFNMNTFTDKEWGDGSESPDLFNPVKLNCEQWASTLKNAGFKAIIITAKHHDGFCLWPSQYTKHSVKYSPWKNGNGDVIRELSDACKKYGLKLGIYYSPWDRNHAEYGKPEYLNYMGNQLAELLKQYGDVFEVWFDGANGGTGYYGGANEKREVDRQAYYNWPEIFKYVKHLQPNTLIFSDGGPDVRWVGNEDGLASETNWSTLNRTEFYPGSPFYQKLGKGSEKGTHWVPAEVDVSIRPGWYYHAREDSKVKSVKELLDIYYNSVGRNASLLLNIPVDRNGLINPNDSARLMAFAGSLSKEMKTNLAPKARISGPSAWNSNSANYQSLTDNNTGSYWMPADTATRGSVIYDFNKPITFNRFMVQEYIAFGQRVKGFTLDIWKDNKWEQVATGTTIGYKRILRFDDLKTTKLRFSITSALAKPLIAETGIYNSPVLLTPPEIRRDQAGTVSITNPAAGLRIYYTTDGTPPNKSSVLYTSTFNLKGKGVINAVCHDPKSNKYSEVTTALFDVCAEKFKLVSPVSDQAALMFDGDNSTTWLYKTKTFPVQVVIDLGKSYALRGFTYLPDQSRDFTGVALHYSLETSTDGKTWRKENEMAEFANIASHPVAQQVMFQLVQGRYIRFTFDDILNKQNQAVGIAEFSIITE